MKRMHTKVSWGRQKTQLSFICASYTSPSDLEVQGRRTDQRNESDTLVITAPKKSYKGLDYTRRFMVPAL